MSFIAATPLGHLNLDTTRGYTATSPEEAIACVKCHFLRVDPAQLPRAKEMTANASERLAEAKDRVWLGEVAGLEDSLKHLRQRRAEAEQQLQTATALVRRPRL